MGAVLLLSDSADDYCTPRVERALRARGAHPAVFLVDRYPSPFYTLGLHFPGGASVTCDGVRHTETDAIWSRRVRAGAPVGGELARSVRLEADRTLRALSPHVGCYTLDPITAMEAATKPRQLVVAAEVGLSVPPTLHTSDPGEARAFAAAHGDVVTKMMHDVRPTGDRHGATVYTNRLRAEDLAALDDLAWCPMTFQARVPSAWELRVIAVGRRCWAAALRTEPGALDWRRTGARDAGRWQRWELPADVAARVDHMQRRLGLDYGAYDFIVTPDGDHVFLEVNPTGEWFWLEDAAGLPIADAIADVLLGACPRRGARDAPM